MGYDEQHEVGRLAPRIETKIDPNVGQYTTGCVLTLLFGIVGIVLFAGLGAFIWFAVQPETSPPVGEMSPSIHVPSPDLPAVEQPAGWDGSGPLVCQGNDQIEVRGVSANLDVIAVTAQANCQLTLTDCSLTGVIGIQAAGNAQVRMVGGQLTGSVAAVDASANAHVTLTGVKVTGKRNSRAGAKIKEQRAR